MSPPPFFVLGMPRARTAWLAEFLSTLRRRCLHEPSQWLRGRPALEELLQIPSVAISDSLMTLRWREILNARPDARIVVAYRDIDAVIFSLMKAGIWHPRARSILHRLDAELATLMCARDVFYVPFEEMSDRERMDNLYAYCNGCRMPPGWWEQWKDRKVLASIPEMFERTAANAAGMLDLYPELKEAV